MPEGDDITRDALLEALAAAPAHPVALVGRVIDERFELRRRAGTGGMGAVFGAYDRARGEEVAVKLLHAVDDLDRLNREVAALRTLEHDAVVRYVAHGETEGGELYIVMEWLEGRDLGARIVEGFLSVPQVVALGRRLCAGLAAIHDEGLLHRDLKPPNVVLVDGEVSRATIVDLGLARRIDGATQLTRSGAALGTVGYMAPEQARGERALTEACDLFALGCVLYEALTGSPAFRGASPVAALRAVLHEEPPLLGPNVPDALAAIVYDLLDKDPAARGSSAGEVGRRLAPLVVETR